MICSILCTLKDGENYESDLQFQFENTPAKWNTEYGYRSDEDVLIEKLNPEASKQCIKVDEEDMKILDYYIEKD